MDIQEYILRSKPIIERIANWERMRGTAACMVSEEEKAEFWDYIKVGFVLGNARAAMQSLDEKF